jgi:hypothetical protein
MRLRYVVLIGFIMVFSVSSVYAETAETFVEWYQRTYQKETNFGASYEAAKSGQILNPEAEKNLDPVYGLDGQAAEIAIEKYRHSFAGSEETPVYPLTIQAPIGFK